MRRLSSRLAFGALFAAVVAGWLAAFGVFSAPPSFLPIRTQNITSGDTSLTWTAALTRLSDFNRDTFTDLVARDTAGKLWISPATAPAAYRPGTSSGPAGTCTPCSPALVT